MRYKAKYRNLKIPMQRAYKTLVGGQTVVTPGTKIEFENSIFETDNEEIIKFLDTDPECLKMQKRNIFAKIEDSVLEAATRQETLEERESRLDKEMKELKKQKKKVTEKEKGTKSKVGSKNEKPAY